MQIMGKIHHQLSDTVLNKRLHLKLIVHKEKKQLVFPVHKTLEAGNENIYNSLLKHIPCICCPIFHIYKRV